MDALERHKKELLRKFIDGSINETDRHQLERLALDDPFLFDAIEAYAQNEGEDLLNIVDNIDLTKAESSLDSVPTSYKPMRRLLQIAAGFIILAAAGYFIRHEININETSSVILVESDQGSETVTMVQDLSEDKYAEEEAYSEELVEQLNEHNSTAPKKLKKEIQSRAEAQKSSPEPAIIETKREAALEIVEKDESPSAKTPTQQDDVQIKGSRKRATDYYVDGVRVNVEPDQTAMGMEKPSSDEAMIDMVSGFSGPFNVSGLVLDHSGEALIGATVIDHVSGQEVRSDIEGNFNIEIPQEQSMLLVKQTGYPDQYFIANHAFQNNTVMEEIPPMDEISIPEKLTKDTYAEPIIGVDRFYKELELFKSSNQTCQDRRTFIISIDDAGELINLYRPRNHKDQCDLDLFNFMKELGKWKTVPINKSFLHRLELNFNDN